GNGSSELIWLAAVAYLAVGDGAEVLGPTFGEYHRAARGMGANVWTVRARAEDGFRPPLAAFFQEVDERRPRLAFLANPNNRTGQLIAAEQMFDVAAGHPWTLFVLDEAYADWEQSTSFGFPPNVMRLRSLTKAHSLAGLRLGYAVADEGVVAALRAVQPPW